MASSIKTIKDRMNATKKTSQITKAMNMVSASKLRGAESSIKSYLPFIDKIEEMLNNLMSNDEVFHPLFEKREVKNTCYILITCERGLAGPFNNNLFKELATVIDENSYICSLGTRGFNHCKKKGYRSINDKPVILKDDVTFYDIYEAVNLVIQAYVTGKIDKVVVLYNHYVNTLVQKVTYKNILPLDERPKSKIKEEYDFEGGVDSILDTLIPLYIENMIYGCILDSKASEHAARMTAMKSATDNAEEVISSLQVVYNRARQAAITLELTDIISGANAISQN